jgi:hypothetical protein
VVRRRTTHPLEIFDAGARLSGAQVMLMRAAQVGMLTKNEFPPYEFRDGLRQLVTVRSETVYSLWERGMLDRELGAVDLKTHRYPLRLTEAGLDYLARLDSLR